jgi:hypothetical protein
VDSGFRLPRRQAGRNDKTQVLLLKSPFCVTSERKKIIALLLKLFGIARGQFYYYE